ncbi:MAG: ribokinase, partial [Phycisphaerae bacterium]|nr:ribokinase [Phycisphaerae bacterium]
MQTEIEKPRVVVVGSANMDLVVRCSRMPKPGETLLGGQFTSSPGGKGANQAVAAARLGAECHFVGRIGNDDFGARLKVQMKASGVNTDRLIATEGVASGVAIIVVDGRGENSIVVASGANERVTPEDIDAVESLIASAKAVLLQLELPLPTVSRAIAIARKHGVMTVLDPAPVPPDSLLPADAYQVDILNPNEIEATQLTGEPIGEDRHSAKLVAAELMRRGAKSVVIKLGRRGALAVEGDTTQFREVPTHSVPVVDTTA